jgi:hypothetical protein
VNTINKKLIVIALTAALVFLVSLGSAWAAPVDCCPDGSPASKYPMRVYVYDTENNNPVRSAAVTISGPSFSVTNYTAKNGWTPVVRKINLDGDYTITVQKSGYSPVTETHSMSGGDYVCEPYIFNIGLGAPCEKTNTASANKSILRFSINSLASRKSCCQSKSWRSQASFLSNSRSPLLPSL